MFSHENLDAGWRVINVTDDIQRVKWLGKADWFMLHMQPMSLLPCIYMAG